MHSTTFSLHGPPDQNAQQSHGFVLKVILCSPWRAAVLGSLYQDMAMVPSTEISLSLSLALKVIAEWNVKPCQAVSAPQFQKQINTLFSLLLSWLRLCHYSSDQG